jgi:hypothetical protein
MPYARPVKPQPPTKATQTFPHSGAQTDRGSGNSHQQTPAKKIPYPGGVDTARQNRAAAPQESDEMQTCRTPFEQTHDSGLFWNISKDGMKGL